MTVSVAAIDLGATSGRVIVGSVGSDELTMTQVARFGNGPVRLDGHLHWNVVSLYEAALGGLKEAQRHTTSLASIGIDSWAVDYGLLRGGTLLGLPFHYRDERTTAGVASVSALASHSELYTRNGLQFLPFNTLYQLAAEDSAVLGVAERLALVPDLLAFWLTGSLVAERTNASTTGLLRATDGEWDTELIEQLGLPRDLFPALVDPGARIGVLRDSVREQIGATTAIPVTAVGSHDTASAVVAVPMDATRAAYISCGTWGLVGVETPAPVLTDEARRAGFTNEGGVDGRTRLLTNVMGLWVLSETIRTWERTGETIDLPSLLRAAAELSTPVSLFDVDDASFLAPGDMPARIAAWLTDRGLPVPEGHAAWARCIVESLAQAFADATHAASALSGIPVEKIHIVGGGALNDLLCQRTADRSGRPVVAGPVEATALGNLLVQARACGELSGSLEDLRDLVARTQDVRLFTPRD